MKDEYENEKLRLIIAREKHPKDPRKQDNLGTMLVLYERRYIPGDKTDLNPDKFCTFDDLESYLIHFKGAEVILPLYYLFHDDKFSIKTQPFYEDLGGWDSGKVGFIYATYEKIKKFYGNYRPSDKEIEDVLKHEVETYNNYLEGNVYMILLERKDTGKTLAFINNIYGIPDENELLDFLNNVKIKKDLEPYLEDLKKKIER